MMAVLAYSIILKGASGFLFFFFFNSVLQPSTKDLIKVIVWSDSFVGFMHLFLQVLQYEDFCEGGVVYLF